MYLWGRVCGLYWKIFVSVGSFSFLLIPSWKEGEGHPISIVLAMCFQLIEVLNWEHWRSILSNWNLGILNFRSTHFRHIGRSPIARLATVTKSKSKPRVKWPCQQFLIDTSTSRQAPDPNFQFQRLSMFSEKYFLYCTKIGPSDDTNLLSGWINMKTFCWTGILIETIFGDQLCFVCMRAPTLSCYFPALLLMDLKCCMSREFQCSTSSDHEIWCKIHVASKKKSNIVGQLIYFFLLTWGFPFELASLYWGPTTELPNPIQ